MRAARSRPALHRGALGALGAGAVASPATAGRAVATVPDDAHFAVAAPRLRDRLVSLAPTAVDELVSLVASS